MPFHLTTLLLLLVVLGSSLAAFGQYGVSVFSLVAVTAISVALSWWILLTLVMLLEFMTIVELVAGAVREWGVQWYNCAALTVWIASLTMLLRQADATRRNHISQCMVAGIEATDHSKSEQTPTQQ
jgi:hypothetical protein